MIEVYKICNCIYDKEVTKGILHFRMKKDIFLRGHSFTLENKRIYTQCRKNYFANRIVNTWNSLPNSLVGAGTLNIFKNSLDRLWSEQELMYNYRAVVAKSDYVY